MLDTGHFDFCCNSKWRGLSRHIFFTKYQSDCYVTILRKLTMVNPNDSGTSTAASNVGGHNVEESPQHSQPAHNVSVVYARLPVPQMTNTNIEAWFTTMEFWFTASGITADRQKMATVLAALSPNVISQLTDVIAALPATERYEYIKTNVIEHFADSEQRRLNRLLSELPLGDKKPSELYFEMKRVAGSTLGDAALKGLWTQRLPAFAQPVVAASSGTPVEFTKIADSICDAMASSQVNQVASGPSSELSEIRAAVVQLTKKFENFSTRSRSRSRSRKPTVARNRSQNRAPYSSDATGDECWYHKKYGRNAQKCRSPCRHKQRKVNVLSTGTSQ